MPARKVAVAEVPDELAEGMAKLRARLEIPDRFPSDALRAAEQAASAPRLPELDRTDLELITIDPEGSRDLDQAMHIAREGEGFLVSYAIADVAAFVTSGDPIDSEARNRGETLYAPDRRTPLHPPELSEGAASLLPGQTRPALLWTLCLDAAGEVTRAEVVRARVRSRAQLSYADAQAEIDGGSPRQTLALLGLVGPLREERERARGGVSLNLPEQEVRVGPDGWSLAYRSPQPIEGWNAQISLLTGMAAAQLMLTGKVGVLRTVPPADDGSIRRLRAVARALRIGWPAGQGYPDFVRSLDPQRPADAAMMNACTSLFRGAGYQAFHETVPELTEHAALASPYAHVTAPLRRRVDRYAGEICLALCGGRPVPEWVLAAMGDLSADMQAADAKAKKYERAIVDLLEVFMMKDRTGETFVATLIDVEKGNTHGSVMLRDPAVEARVNGANLPLGEEIAVRVASVDEEKGMVTFERVPSPR